MNAEIWERICELKGYVDACVDSDPGTGDGVPFAMLEAIQTKVDAIKAAKTLDDDSVRVRSSLEEKYAVIITAETRDDVGVPE